MKFKLQLLLIVFFLHLWCASALAIPNSKWTLQACVQYALDHNIQIKQSELNKRLQSLTYQQSQLAQLPNFNTGTNYG